MGMEPTNLPSTAGVRRIGAGRRRPSALILGCLLLVGAISPLLAASPAAADPPVVDCSQTPGDPACGKVEPTLSCVWTSGSGFTAVFGFNNSSTSTVVAPIGSLNGFSPSPTDRGQLTTFPPGKVTSAFTVAWSSGSITWSLLGRTRLASGSSTPCASSPAPALAETGLVLGCLAIGVLVCVAVFRERNAPRPERLLDRLLPR
jgi:hypothetical protein